MTVEAAAGAGTVPTTFTPDPAAAAGNAGGDAGAVKFPAFSEWLPAELKEKQFFQDIAKNDDPWTAMAKGYADAQTVIGKRPAGLEIPGEGAAPEAVKAFHKALGVPDSPDGYQYQAPDISKEPEAVRTFLGEAAKDDTLMKSMRTVAHEAGITPAQFAKLASAFDVHNVEQARAIITAAETQSNASKEHFSKYYGERAESAERIAKDTVSKVIPEDVRKLGDVNLAFAVAMNFIHEKLYKSDTISAQGDAPSSMSKAEIQSKIFELRKDPAYKNKFAGAAHRAVNEKVDALYAELHSKD